MSHSSGTRPRAKFATLNRYGGDQLLAVCGIHAAAERKRAYRGQPDPIQDLAPHEPAIRARLDAAYAAAREREAIQDRERAERFAARRDAAWRSYPDAWEVTLELEEGWREAEIRWIRLWVHPAGLNPQHFGCIEVQPTDDGFPAAASARNLNTAPLTPKACEALRDAAAYMAEIIRDLNAAEA
jgi:hypothetical protein